MLETLYDRHHSISMVLRLTEYRRNGSTSKKMLFASILLLSVSHVVWSATTSCSEKQFTCKNKECIDIEKKCDQTVDCSDQSDELFETCYNSNCDEETQFQCGNGGCIDKSKICIANISDPNCLDGSDLNEFLCANDTTITKLLEDLRGSCSSDYALYCTSGKHMCLKWSQVCDGHIECKDGLDESLKICGGSVCPPGSFRCQSGICIDKDKMCDTILDCFDGSDELPDICGIRVPPENTPDEPKNPDDIDEPSHTGGGGGSHFWTPAGCEITQMPGLRLSDFFLEYSYGSVKYVPPQTVVNKGCDAGYRLLGSSVSICNQQNEWSSELDSCVRECNQDSEWRHPSYTMQCRSDSKTLKDCNEKPIAHSSIRLSCAPGYEATNGIDHADYNCTDSGNWTNYDRKPECQPICGIISKFHPDVVPWTVSIYRLNNSIFEFRCLGTIVSFDVVFTAEGCFEDELPLAEKYMHYAVVVGNHSVSFKLNEEHGYTVHTIANVHTVTAPNGLKFYKATILTLAKPLVLGAKVMPACLDLNQSNSFSIINDDFAGKANGTGITQVDQTGKHTLILFVNDPNTSYSIDGYSAAISDTIRKKRVY